MRHSIYGNVVAAEAVKLLIIDDDQNNLDLMRAALDMKGLEIHVETDPKAGVKLIYSVRPQIVLLDLIIPGVQGMELLQQIVEIDPGIDVILMTGYYSTESAVEAIHKGASDYLPKPFSIEKLRQRVLQLVEEANRRQRGFKLENDLAENFELEGLIGRSLLMLDLFSKIRRISPHFRSVLITGATGVGKELVAKALHHLSPVGKAPFVALNCSSISESLAESELFGHVKGAFTGAVQDKVGIFEYAKGGTTLLDEIGDMPLAIQAKLLRVLQNQEIQRVGSPALRRVDVRVIGATNRDLSTMVSEGKFRQDLYFRLCMVELKVPSLAERAEDLPLLERHFLNLFAARYKKPFTGITRRAQIVLARYSWPGNVRELENAIGHACMMAEANVIDIRDLPKSIRDQKSPAHGGLETLMPLEQIERLHAQGVLDHFGGNKVRAAETLRISRTQLYRILKGSKEELKPLASQSWAYGREP